MSKRGFTIIEILVVVGIIAVLTAAAIPMYNRARARSTDTKMLNTWREACERYANYMGSGGTSALAGTWLINEGFSTMDVTACTTNDCILSAKTIQSGDIPVGDTIIHKSKQAKCQWDINNQKMTYTEQ